jgi:uncharacterized protein YajQ (UPF0234 family)
MTLQINQKIISEMKVIPTTEFEIKSIIKLLKSKTSTRYYGISSRIIKHCMNAVSRPINHIRNASINEGVFPDRLKYAIVKLLHEIKLMCLTLDPFRC